MQQETSAHERHLGLSKFEQELLYSLREMRTEIPLMRGALESIDRRTSNNAARLEALDALIRERDRVVQQPPARVQTPPTPWRQDRVVIASCCLAALLAFSSRVRRALRKLPLSVVLLAQGSAASALLVYRALDTMEELLSNTRAASVHAKTQRENKRLLAYGILLLSTIATPAKGVCHLLAAGAGREAQAPARAAAARAI
jgi:hypothetical protein